MYNAIIFTDLTHDIVSTIYLGPYKCAHVLRKSGYSCLVINHSSDYTANEIKELLDIAVGKQTYFVGFSTTFILSQEKKPDLSIQSVFPQGKAFEDQIISYIKQKNPKIKTVAGGSNVHAEYTNKNIDYVMIGYSEISIVNLANHLAHNETLNHSYKNIHGRIIIDDRKAPDYDFPSGDMVWLDTDVVNHKLLPIEIGRGCIFKCKFCGFAMNGKQQLDFVKKPEILYNEMLRNYTEFGITQYIIVDDTFNDHVEKLQAIYEQVKRLPFQPMFWAYTRLDLICTRPETLPLLYGIGLRAMFFGIETLDAKTGRTIGKGFDRKKQIEMIKHIKETYADVTLYGSFIFGLPYESVESMISTADQLLDGSIPLDTWNIHPLSIRKKNRHAFASDLTDNYEAYGYIDQGDTEDWTTTHNVNWKNEYLTANIAKDLAANVMKDSIRSERYKVGVAAFHMQTMGYSFLENKDLPMRTFNWDNVKEVKKKFVEEYKAQLLNLVKQKVSAR